LKIVVNCERFYISFQKYSEKSKGGNLSWYNRGTIPDLLGRTEKIHEEPQSE
jgi:hypothetical protein